MGSTSDVEKGEIAAVVTHKFPLCSLCQQQRLLFGKTVDQPFTSAGISNMFKQFLDHTTIKSKKKMHLARRSMPTLMQALGVTMDEIDAIGHWADGSRARVYQDKLPSRVSTKSNATTFYSCTLAYNCFGWVRHRRALLLSLGGGSC